MGNQPESPDAILAELIAIKRLLVHGLMQSGAKQEDIAKALGVGQATVSRMFSNDTRKPQRSKARSK